MIYFLVVISTIFSCYLFERVHFDLQITPLRESYILTYKLLKRKVKTEFIIVESAKQLKLISLLFLKIVCILLPFLLPVVYLYFMHLNLAILISDLSISLTAILSGITYFLLKRYAFK